MFENFSSEFFTLYPASNDTGASEMNNELFRGLSRLSVWLWAQAWLAGGVKSNVCPYYFTRSPAENPTEGAYHGSELWYIFNNISYANYSNVTWPSEDYAIESQMSEYWANFIKTGNPNGGDLTEWPAYSSDSKNVMWLGDSFGSSYLTESNARAEFLEIWLGVLHELVERPIIPVKW